jgi:hypothetical protein
LPFCYFLSLFRTRKDNLINDMRIEIVNFYKRGWLPKTNLPVQNTFGVCRTYAEKMITTIFSVRHLAGVLTVKVSQEGRKTPTPKQNLFGQG